MVDRLTDSLKKASARAEDFTKAESREKPRLFVQFVDALKVAAGSSHQLAHSRIDQSPHWLGIRDRLEGIIEISQKLPTFTGESNFLWQGISDSLKALSKAIKELFDSRALPYATVDKMLQARLERANELN